MIYRLFVSSFYPNADLVDSSAYQRHHGDLTVVNSEIGTVASPLFLLPSTCRYQILHVHSACTMKEAPFVMVGQRLSSMMRMNMHCQRPRMSLLLRLFSSLTCEVFHTSADKTTSSLYPPTTGTHFPAHNGLQSHANRPHAAAKRSQHAAAYPSWNFAGRSKPSPLTVSAAATTTSQPAPFNTATFIRSFCRFAHCQRDELFPLPPSRTATG